MFWLNFPIPPLRCSVWYSLMIQTSCSVAQNGRLYLMFHPHSYTLVEVRQPLLLKIVPFLVSVISPIDITPVTHNREWGKLRHISKWKNKTRRINKYDYPQILSAPNGICCYGNYICKYIKENSMGSLILIRFTFFPLLFCFSDISHFQEQNDLKGLLENLHQNIQAKKRKNVEIMWLAATVGTLLSNGIACHRDDQKALSGICYVGSNLCTLGYQMSFSIIQEIRHLVYQ